MGKFCLATAVRGRDYHAREDDTHYKPSLIKVVDIVIHDTILGLNVSYEGKPFANDLWILTLGPLVVVSTRITHIELWLAFDEIISPAFADRGRIAFV